MDFDWKTLKRSSSTTRKSSKMCPPHAPFLIFDLRFLFLYLSRAVLFFTNWNLFTYEKWILGESKMVHEVGQISTDFGDFGVVGKPWTSAFQPRQNHQNPLRFDPFHDPFFISSPSPIRKQIAQKSQALNLSTTKSKEAQTQVPPWPATHRAGSRMLHQHRIHSSSSARLFFCCKRMRRNTTERSTRIYIVNSCIFICRKNGREKIKNASFGEANLPIDRGRGEILIVEISASNGTFLIFENSCILK